MILRERLPVWSWTIRLHIRNCCLVARLIYFQMFIEASSIGFIGPG